MGIPFACHGSGNKDPDGVSGEALQLFQIWKGSVCPIPRQLCCGRLVPPQALIPCAAIFITGRGVADRPLVVSAAPVADCPVGRVSCGVWLRVALRWRG